VGFINNNTRVTREQEIRLHFLHQDTIRHEFYLCIFFHRLVVSNLFFLKSKLGKLPYWGKRNDEKEIKEKEKEENEKERKK
jgi:hypothetical protein